MGKVYEALLRAESADAMRDVADLEAADIEAIEVEDEREIHTHGFARNDELNNEPDFESEFDDRERGPIRNGFNWMAPSHRLEHDHRPGL